MEGAKEFGEKVELKKANLYDPDRRKRDQTITYTEGGRVAGAVINFVERILGLKFKNCNAAIYDKVDAWWVNHGIKIFFFLWEPVEHPTDVWPVINNNPTLNAPYKVSGELREITLGLRGVAE